MKEQLNGLNEILKQMGMEGIDLSSLDELAKIKPHDSYTYKLTRIPIMIEHIDGEKSNAMLTVNYPGVIDEIVDHETHRDFIYKNTLYSTNLKVSEILQIIKPEKISE